MIDFVHDVGMVLLGWVGLSVCAAVFFVLFLGGESE